MQWLVPCFHGVRVKETSRVAVCRSACVSRHKKTVGEGSADEPRILSFSTDHLFEVKVDVSIHFLAPFVVCFLAVMFSTQAFSGILGPVLLPLQWFVKVPADAPQNWTDLSSSGNCAALAHSHPESLGGRLNGLSPRLRPPTHCAAGTA